MNKEARKVTQHMNERYTRIFNTPKQDNPYLALLYARGFLISDKPIVVKDSWVQRSFGNGLYITYDSRNECEYVTCGDTWVLILGTVMDTQSWHMNMDTVAQKVAEKFTLGEEFLYDYLDYLGGRHLIVYGNKTDAYLVQDATGMRSVCYHRHSLLVASHYNIINQIVHAEKNPFVEDMVQMNPVPWLLPGNMSPYMDIMIMMPNRRLSLFDRSLKRIFPRGPRLKTDVNTAMDYIADCCKKQLETLSRYKELMFSITKGNDSRITMAASHGLQDASLYFTYYGEQDPDLMSDLYFTREFSRKHNMHYKEVPVAFCDPKAQYGSLMDVCYHNHYHFHMFYSIPSMLKQLPSDRIAVRSNLIEIIRADYYSDLPAGSDWEKVAKRLYYGHKMDDPAYRQVMQTFFEENQYDNIYDYHTGDLIYWEYRMGLWMNNGILLKDDTCFDTYMLFNHRKMLEYGLGIPRYFKKKNAVVHEVIRRLYPEMLYELPNTDNTLLDYYLTDTRNLVEMKDGQLRGYHIADDSSVPLYSSIGRYHALFGFGSSVIRNGSICEYTVDIPVKAEGVYTIQLTLNVSNEFNYTSNFAHYTVSVNDEKCFALGLTDFMNKDNQINIIKHLPAQTLRLRIQLKAEKDYDASDRTPGILQIRNISVARQWNYNAPEKTVVISTDQMFRDVISKK